MRYEPALYRSPIALPERAVGKLSVKHRLVEKEVAIIGLRQAILCGRSALTARLAEPLRVHELREEGRGVWMTDLPEELNQIGEALWNVQPEGRVLVGGLGLGVLAAILSVRDTVDEVVVVERSPEVIELCAAEGYEVVQADIAEFLRVQDDGSFDCYMLDTWQGTNEATWWSEVFPLRRTIRQRWGSAPKVHCWAEDVMLGQVRASLLLPKRFWKYAKLPLMTPDEADLFLTSIGTPAWERDFAALVEAND
jgi:hypothetical protein